MSINLLTTPEADLQAAFDLLEGDGFYAASAADAYYEHLGGVRKALAHPERIDGFLVLYGRGGWHRYFVRTDGTVLADAHYGINPQSAASVGFDLR